MNSRRCASPTRSPASWLRASSHHDVVSWIRAVELLGLSSGDENRQPGPERLKETHPIDYHILELERAADAAYYDPIIEDFEGRQQRLWDAFGESLKAPSAGQSGAT